MVAEAFIEKYRQVQIEDCALIWEAKTLDSDSYCAVDIQLVVFAGVDVTIDYLRNAVKKKRWNMC